MVKLASKKVNALLLYNITAAAQSKVFYLKEKKNEYMKYCQNNNIETEMKILGQTILK